MFHPIVRPKVAVVSKSTIFTFFSYKSLSVKSWPLHKIGQSQPGVIVWIKLVVLAYPVLHTKFHGYCYIGSGEVDFQRFLPYMDVAAMMVVWSRPFELVFVRKGPGYCIWNSVTIGGVRGDVVTYCERTTQPAYTISFPGAFGTGELKTWQYGHN